LDVLLAEPSPGMVPSKQEWDRNEGACCIMHPRVPCLPRSGSPRRGSAPRSEIASLRTAPAQIGNEIAVSRQSSRRNRPAFSSCGGALRNPGRGGLQYGFDHYDDNAHQNQGHHRDDNRYRWYARIKGFPGPARHRGGRSVRSRGWRIRMGKEESEKGDAGCFQLNTVIPPQSLFEVALRLVGSGPLAEPSFYSTKGSDLLPGI